MLLLIPSTDTVETQDFYPWKIGIKSGKPPGHHSCGIMNNIDCGGNIDCSIRNRVFISLLNCFTTLEKTEMTQTGERPNYSNTVGL